MATELDDFLGEYNRKAREQEQQIKDKNQKDKEDKEAFDTLFVSRKKSAIEPAIKELTETLNKHGHKLEKDGIIRATNNHAQGYNIRFSSGASMGFEIIGDLYAKNAVINFSIVKSGQPKTDKFVCKAEELTTKKIVDRVFEEIKKVLV